jgi:hypothetical protein
MSAQRNLRPGKRARMTAALAAAALATVLAGCAGSPPSDPGPGSTPTSVPTTKPSPSPAAISAPSTNESKETTSMPSLSASGLPPPSAFGAVVTLQGTVVEGVEAGCQVLVDDGGAVPANLLGLDAAVTGSGGKIE